MCIICDTLLNEESDNRPPSSDTNDVNPVVPAQRQPVDVASSNPPEDFEQVLQRTVDEIMKGLGQTVAEPEPVAPKPPTFLDQEQSAREDNPSPTVTLPLPGGSERIPSEAEMFALLDLGRDLFGLEKMISLIALMISATPEDEVVVDVRLRKRGEEDSYRADPADEVARWYEAIGQKRYEELYDPAQQRDLLDRFRSLHAEEADEIDTELYELAYYSDTTGSRAKLAKELADEMVHLYGTAYIMDIPLDDVVEAVMEKNWEKINPATGKPYQVRADGKVLKPEGFKDLTEGDIFDIIG